jgi:predicted ATP-dependent serine protease
MAKPKDLYQCFSCGAKKWSSRADARCPKCHTIMTFTGSHTSAWVQALKRKK